VQCNSPAERKKYASTVVWVAMCNHWRVTGKQQIENPAGKAQVLSSMNLHLPCTESVYLKCLGIFITNNWRLKRGVSRFGHHIPVRNSSVVWDIYKNWVEEEIQRHIHQAAQDQTLTEWLPKLMPSIWDVWNKLSDTQRNNVQIEAERRTHEGLSLEAKAKWVAMTRKNVTIF